MIITLNSTLLNGKFDRNVFISTKLNSLKNIDNSILSPPANERLNSSVKKLFFIPMKNLLMNLRKILSKFIILFNTVLNKFIITN